MPDARERVTIAVDDPQCGGVTSADGKRQFDTKDRRIELPEYEARQILASGHGGVARYRKSWGVGIDLKALEATRRKREEAAKNVGKTPDQ